jgi:ABC-type sugar transport system, periplasmic component
MKKILSFLFIASFSLLTACNTKETAPVIPTSDYDIPLEISIAFWDIQAMENAATKDPMWEYIEKKFNITLIPINLNWSDYNERLLVMSVSNSLPDVFATNTLSNATESTPLLIEDLLNRQLIRALPSDLSTYPYIEQAVSELREFITYTDHHIYTFPRCSFLDSSLSSSDAGVLVRKDWMETLGISEPKNIDEFIAMTSAFANDDPDRNGLDDTIGYNSNTPKTLGKWLNLGIAPYCNVYSWIEHDGQFIPSFLSPEFEQVIITYRKLYETGGLDPNFHTKKTNDALYDFARGTLGVLEHKLSPAAISEVEMQWNAFQGNSLAFEDAVTYLPIFPAPDGTIYSNSSLQFWSESMFSSNVDDEKMERILALYDYLMSEEGFMLTRYGMEGLDYKIDENGNYVCLLDTSTDSLNALLTQRYPALSIFKSLATWGGTQEDFLPNEANILRYGEYPTQLAYDSLIWNLENTTSLSRADTFNSLIKENNTSFSTSSMQDNFIEVIIGTEDALSMWHDMIANWYEEGLGDYIYQQNEAANEKGIFVR